jgi:hypothetical protein
MANTINNMVDLFIRKLKLKIRLIKMVDRNNTITDKRITDCPMINPFIVDS